jgi:ABC-type branched-subunit amino acid transport system substrate-binding protein
MRRNGWRALALAMVLALVAGACGGDHGGDESGAATTVPTSGSGGTGAETTTTEPAGEMFGDLESPCGPGDASGATANGVTDTEITIGYGDDSDYPPAPGLTREIGDAVRAMIDWCNEQGGINGRTIVGKYYDAKLLQVAEAMTQACNDKVFMLVGQGWALDAGQEQLRIECQLSTIPTYSVSTAFAHGSGMMQPAPNPGDEGIAAAAFQLAQLFPDKVKKAAFVFAEYPPTRETRDKYAASYPEAGWQFLDCDQIYNIAGESDWRPFAENLKACGVEMVAYVGSATPNLQNLMAASNQVGFNPVWYADANNYTASFAEWNASNGNVADNLYVRMAFVPFEFADQVPAVKQLSEIVNDSGGKLALLSAQATSAFLLWATAAKACGSELTPKCVLDEVAKQTAWTGGGLHTEMNPGTNDGPTCGMLIKPEGSAWVKAFPTGDELFDCDDRYLIRDITTPALEAAKLDANRVSTQFGQFTPS